MTIKYLQDESEFSHDELAVLASNNINHPSNNCMDEIDEEVPDTTALDSDEASDNDNPETNLDLVQLPGRKYRYILEVDENDNDKATTFKFLRFDRPHMRAFWGTNLAHRATVFMWFSAVPLYSSIQETLHISKEGMWTSYMCAMLGALVGRVIAGFACHVYGPRLTSAGLILFGIIPTTLQGAATNLLGFCLARFFTSIAGGVYVASVVWMDGMFDRDFAGRLHGFSGGLGAATGLSQVFLGLMVFPALKHYCPSEEIAWRLSFSFVSLGCLVVGIGLIFLTDDTPHGNYAKLKKTGSLTPVPVWESLMSSLNNKNVWILSLQYGCNFGVELAINNALIAYFTESYGLSNNTSVILSSFLPVSNQFARMAGGRFSDRAQINLGMKGRLQCQLMFNLGAGALFVVFSFTQRLWVSLTCLSFMALLLLFAQSATFGIVPYINPQQNEIVIGVVSTIGIAGGLLIALIFRSIPTYREAFCITGYVIVFTAVLTIFIDIPGHDNLLSKKEVSGEKGFTSCITGETDDSAVSIDTSTHCAHEFADSMCIVSPWTQEKIKLEDLPHEINVQMKRRPRMPRKKRPFLEKSFSDSMLQSYPSDLRSEPVPETYSSETPPNFTKEEADLDFKTPPNFTEEQEADLDFKTPPNFTEEQEADLDFKTPPNFTEEQKVDLDLKTPPNFTEEQEADLDLKTPPNFTEEQEADLDLKTPPNFTGEQEADLDLKLP